MASGKSLYGPSEMLACRSTADYSGATVGQYRFMGYSGSSSSVDGVPTVTRCSSAGAECLGVLTDKPKSGETASVQTGGLAKVEAGAALSTIGAYVASDRPARPGRGLLRRRSGGRDHHRSPAVRPLHRSLIDPSFFSPSRAVSKSQAPSPGLF
jgi:hypothetical protein